MATVQTADKAIDVLEAVAASGDGVGTRALARSLQMNIASVHNLAKTLVARGYLRQDVATKRFHTGLRLMMLGRHTGYLEQLASIGRPFVHRLAAELNESVMLGALDLGRVINLEYVPSTQALRVQEPTDLADIVHCTAVGKVMLAAMSPASLEAYLGETRLRSFTPHTITARPKLLKELETVRRRGYGSTRDELCEGSSAVAVPVKDPWGATVAALAASAPTLRMDRPEQREKTLDALRLAAAELTRQWLGLEGRGRH